MGDVLPVEEEPMEEPDPLQIFPEELWRKVLTKMTTLDRLNLCRSNFQMDLLFGTCKSQWLLDQVLPFIMKHFTEKGHLLKCRQICKDWTKIVDTFLSKEHPSRRSFDGENIVDQINSQKASVYFSLARFQLEYNKFTPDNLHKFLNCPPVLIGRSVFLLITCQWRLEEIFSFWEATKQFLQHESQGKDIWHLMVVQLFGDFTPPQFYTILSEALRLVPNLRSMSLRCGMGHLSNFEEGELKVAFRTHPLPPLPDLHSMEIEGVPQVFQQHFLKQYAPQLDKLSLCMYTYPETESHFTLKQLQVKRIRDENTLQKVLLLTQTPDHNLTKLTFDLSLCPGISVPELLDALQKFKKLNQLRLVHHSTVSFESGMGYGTLPSLKYFELEGDWRYIFYFSTFLYALPFLEYLHIRDTSYSGNSEDSGKVRRNRTTDEENVEIQEYILNGKMHLSPIWNTLQHLKIFTFERPYSDDDENEGLKVFCNRETVKYLRKVETEN